jgi:hypothetical protein
MEPLNARVYNHPRNAGVYATDVKGRHSAGPDIPSINRPSSSHKWLSMPVPFYPCRRELSENPTFTSCQYICSEVHGTLQTRHLLLMHRVDVRYDSVFPLGDLRWDLNALGQLHRALLQRTAQVDVADLVAEVGLLLDQRDQAVFDLEEDFGAGFDIFGEGADGGDGEVGAWGGWIGREVDVVDREDVVGRVGAVLGEMLGWRCERCSGATKLGLLTVRGLSPGTGNF